MTLIAAGKAAGPMAVEYLEHASDGVTAGIVAAPARSPDPQPGPLEWVQAGHPTPDAGSVAAGRRALALAAGTPPSGLVLVLLSGGASAALAVPAAGLQLTDKVQATRALLAAGVPIDRINCVRKHLSAIKGGWLAAAARAPILTLAVSDVVGPVADDPAVIGSGPTTADPTGYGDALAVALRPAVREAFPLPALRALEDGSRGLRPETPKPADPRLEGARTVVIGNRLDAVAAAGVRAAELGYAVVTLPAPVVGEARDTVASYLAAAHAAAAGATRPACVLSAGETTVTVRGGGRGGRNQEFALAAAQPLAALADPAALLSIGTDGIDGPTDAAGAVVDRWTLARAADHGLAPAAAYLERNDAYRFFDPLGDLVRPGPTATNVGDLQVLLLP